MTYIIRSWLFVVKGVQMLKKYCNHAGCNTLIDYNEKYCSKHKRVAAVGQKEYDKYIRDKVAKAFYNSKAWKILRKDALVKQNGIDVYLYVTEGVIVKAEHVHHIIERSEDASRALDINNLICLSSKTHSMISKLYKQSKTKKKETQKMLFDILKKYNEMMQGRGDKKV